MTGAVVVLIRGTKTIQDVGNVACDIRVSRWADRYPIVDLRRWRGGASLRAKLKPVCHGTDLARGEVYARQATRSAFNDQQTPVQVDGETFRGLETRRHWVEIARSQDLPHDAGRPIADPQLFFGRRETGRDVDPVASIREDDTPCRGLPDDLGCARS
jgi:hypothetical protein